MPGEYNYQGGVNTLLTRPSVPIIDFLAIRRGQQMREDTDRLDELRRLQGLRESDWEEERNIRKDTQNYVAPLANEFNRRVANNEDPAEVLRNLMENSQNNARYMGYNARTQASIDQQLKNLGLTHLQSAVNANDIARARALAEVTGANVNFGNMYAGAGDAERAVEYLNKTNPNEDGTPRYVLSKNKDQIIVNGRAFDTAQFLKAMTSGKAYDVNASMGQQLWMNQQQLAQEQAQMQNAAELRKQLGLGEQQEKTNPLNNNVVTDSAGNKYTVENGVLKPVTGADAIQAAGAALKDSSRDLDAAARELNIETEAPTTNLSAADASSGGYEKIGENFKNTISLPEKAKETRTKLQQLRSTFIGSDVNSDTQKMQYNELLTKINKLAKSLSKDNIWNSKAEKVFDAYIKQASDLLKEINSRSANYLPEGVNAWHLRLPSNWGQANY